MPQSKQRTSPGCCLSNNWLTSSWAGWAGLRCHARGWAGYLCAPGRRKFRNWSLLAWLRSHGQLDEGLARRTELSRDVPCSRVNDISQAGQVWHADAPSMCSRARACARRQPTVNGHAAVCNRQRQLAEMTRRHLRALLCLRLRGAASCPTCGVPASA